MADVAKHVGVSRALVSIVFRGVDGASEATRQRVLDAAAELGYRPDSLAQGLRRSRTRNLGVLFSLRRPFEVELVEQMYPVVAKLGYHLLLGAFTPARGQDVVVDELLRYRCEGLIVVGPELHGRDLEPLAEEVAVVEVGRGVTRGLVDVVRNDDAVGTRRRSTTWWTSATVRSPTSTAVRTPGRTTGVRATARRWPTTAWRPRSGSFPVVTPRTRGPAPGGRCSRTGFRRP
jgi:hypothetical protein